MWLFGTRIKIKIKVQTVFIYSIEWPVYNIILISNGFGHIENINLYITYIMSCRDSYHKNLSLSKKMPQRRDNAGAVCDSGMACCF